MPHGRPALLTRGIVEVNYEHKIFFYAYSLLPPCWIDCIIDLNSTKSG